MAQTLALIAGSGALPLEVAHARPDALFITYSDAVKAPLGHRHFKARFEGFGALFEALHKNGIQDVIFAGALSRPNPDITQFDAMTKDIWPRFIAALGQGDDALLREIIAIFNEQGFRVLGAHEAVPELVAQTSMSRGPKMDAQARADLQRGFDILSALSPHDVAQSVVIEGGQVFGIETLQGTDAMLEFVAATPAHLRRGRGVFVKTAKKGQDLRVDMPVIGPQTVLAVAKAGLAGLVIEAGRVMILEQKQFFDMFDAHGLFLEVR